MIERSVLNMVVRFVAGLMMVVAIVMVSVIVPSAARAQSSAMPVSYDEFKGLATELAPKVNLFRDVWAADPTAEFFGGTSRDFLYWLKGRLVRAAARGKLAEEIAELRAKEVIDVRSFILFESDVDVVSKSYLSGIEATRYGVNKIDSISSDRFDPSTPAGRNEIDQGFIPAEKIRIGRQGVSTDATFGDGAREIFESRVTVRFAPDAQFWQTHYAKEGRNHPVLLALRYMRLVAVDYFQSEGRGAPNRQKLFSRMPEADQAEVMRVVEAALNDSRISRMMKDGKFKKWMNGTLQKAFRSYTSPEAARALFEHFKASQLSKTFGSIDPINMTLFSAVRDRALIEKNLDAYGVNRDAFFRDVSKEFSDGRLYHGTRDEGAFRSIIFQGVLPSEGGTGGKGLYGVARSNIDFAIQWSGEKDLVVSMEVAKTARVVDITTGEGQRVFKAFGGDYEKFAEAFGADILRYPYTTKAYVVKNGAVLSEMNGYTRKIMPLDEIREHLMDPKTKVSLKSFVQLARDNGLNAEEFSLLAKHPVIASRISSAFKGMEFGAIVKSAEWKDSQAREVLSAMPIVRERARTAIVALVGPVTIELMRDPEKLLVHVDKLYEKFRVSGSMGTNGSTGIINDILTEEMRKSIASWTVEQIEDRMLETYKQDKAYEFVLLVAELAARRGATNLLRTATKQTAMYFYNNHRSNWNVGEGYREALQGTDGSEQEKAFTNEFLERWLALEKFPIGPMIVHRDSLYQVPGGHRLLGILLAKFGISYFISTNRPFNSSVWDAKAAWIIDQYLREPKGQSGWEDNFKDWFLFVIKKAPDGVRDAAIVRIWSDLKNIVDMSKDNWAMFLTRVMTHERFKELSIRHEVVAAAEKSFALGHGTNFEFRDSRGRTMRSYNFPEVLREGRNAASYGDRLMEERAKEHSPLPVARQESVTAPAAVVKPAPQVVRVQPAALPPEARTQSVPVAKSAAVSKPVPAAAAPPRPLSIGASPFGARFAVPTSRCEMIFKGIDL